MYKIEIYERIKIVVGILERHKLQRKIKMTKESRVSLFDFKAMSKLRAQPSLLNGLKKEPVEAFGTY